MPAASGSRKKISGDNFRCKQCKYRTTRKKYLKAHLERHARFIQCTFCEFKTFFKLRFNRHVAQYHGLIIKHTNPDEVYNYKCDQCDYQTIYKRYLKSHSLKHKNSDKVDMYKCDQCEFQRVQGNFKNKVQNTTILMKLICINVINVIIKQFIKSILKHIV